jgi:hypothetical protein
MDSKAAKVAICRHIMIHGNRCQSAAITGSKFCYFHRVLRGGHRAVTAVVAPLRPETLQYLLQNGQSPAQFASSRVFNYPPLEDAESIQITISLVFAAIAARQIDPDVARGLLYALQVASCNLRVLPSRPESGQEQSTLVSRIVRSRNGETLAARGIGNGIPSQAPSRESRFGQMLNDLLHPKDTQSDASIPATTPDE